MKLLKTAKVFGIDPKVAMLSYSTYGSGKGDMVTLVANATKKIKEAAPDLAVDGELTVRRCCCSGGC